MARLPATFLAAALVAAAQAMRHVPVAAAKMRPAAGVHAVPGAAAVERALAVADADKTGGSVHARALPVPETLEASAPYKTRVVQDLLARSTSYTNKLYHKNEAMAASTSSDGSTPTTNTRSCVAIAPQGLDGFDRQTNLKKQKRPTPRIAQSIDRKLFYYDALPRQCDKARGKTTRGTSYTSELYYQSEVKAASSSSDATHTYPYSKRSALSVCPVPPAGLRGFLPPRLELIVKQRDKARGKTSSGASYSLTAAYP